MIKQDYILRMIQKVIAVLIEMLLGKGKPDEKEMQEYNELIPKVLGTDMADLENSSPDDILARYSEKRDGMQNIELAALTLLMIADRMDDRNLLRKSRLRQNGIALIKYVQQHSGTFSFEREELIQLHRS